jgi:cyclic pyranopterin phosphate synthase
MNTLSDTFNRNINYLRISITDRCNLRCIYCMPPDGIKSLSHNEVLRYEEILTIVKAAAELGISKIRLTGGEPLVRLGLADLVRMIANIAGIDDIALTTNGLLLRKYASTLKEAGLKRVNVSLDSLREDRYKQITRIGSLSEALDGIAAAKEAGLNPVKINMVVIQGLNDDEILDFAKLSLNKGWHIRFIEPMPFTAGTKFSFVPISEIVARLNTLGDMEPYLPGDGNGPAKYFRYKGAQGTIGFISPISECFCSTCNRLRLTADGKLRPCLMSDDELDLRTLLRNGASSDELKRVILKAIETKPERHHLSEGECQKGRTMCQMGG